MPGPAMKTVYYWCKMDGQCWAEWLHGQGANNLFTLAGALASAFVAALALWLSQQSARAERRERAERDLWRARLTAESLKVEVAPLARKVADMQAALIPAVDDLMAMVDPRINAAWSVIIGNLVPAPPLCTSE